jgi:hypothetical protein
VDTKRAQELFRKYSPGMAYVAVQAFDGSHSIGSAFHIGEGVFITARHVVENKQVLEVRPTSPVYLPISRVLKVPGVPPEQVQAEYVKFLGEEPQSPVYNHSLSLVSEPVFHHDHRVDVGAFRVELPESGLPYLPLGSHLDDWFHDIQFVLSEAIVMGYPPIPMTTAPYLVAARAEVNSVIHTWLHKHCRFILSSTPRGGFSGGVAISESDFVLGVVTESLVINDTPSELGFLNVLSVEPIFECLGKNKMLPACQRGRWEDFWSTDTVHLSTSHGRGLGSVAVCDDGSKLYIEVHCDENALFEEAARLVDAAVIQMNVERSLKRERWVRWQVATYRSADAELFRAIAARTVAFFDERGIRTIHSSR